MPHHLVGSIAQDVVQIAAHFEYDPVAAEYGQIEDGIDEVAQASLAFAEELERAFAFGHVTHRGDAHGPFAQASLFRLQLGAESRAVLAHASDHIGTLVLFAQSREDAGQVFGRDVGARRVRPEQRLAIGTQDFGETLVCVDHHTALVDHDALERSLRQHLEAFARLLMLVDLAGSGQGEAEQAFDERPDLRGDGAVGAQSQRVLPLPHDQPGSLGF